MDPITALAAASAIWSGIKSCIQAGQEVQDVWGQLTEWADKAGHVYDYLNAQDSKPSIFKHLEFKDSETKEALNIFAARKQLLQMEQEIKHEFLYGALCHYGMDGYKEFLDIRHQVKYQRLKAVADQQRAKDAFYEDLKYGAILTGLLLFLAGLIWWLYINMKG
jgi:hypothetical protein